MEYALEGHGYCWSRVFRERQASRSPSSEEQARLDTEIDNLAVTFARGGALRDQMARIDAPPELLASLHVRAADHKGSPRAALALEVATSVKAVFDHLGGELDLRISHCAFDDRSPGAYLVLGACSRTLAAEVAHGDSVAAGVVVALHDQGGGASPRIEVLSRIFRKVCENGAMIHERDEPAVEVDARLLGAGRARLTGEIERRVAASLDPAFFAATVEAFQASAADPLDYRGGELGPLLRNALPYDQLRAVMARYTAETWTRWGLANALTAEARWAKTFEEARRLERIGGTLARAPATTLRALPADLLDPAGAAAAVPAAAEEAAAPVPSV
jgi:hypothetical protein